ncbi:nucleotidyltransferase family protein [Mycoplasmopsis agassizii]|uniref:Nucleotidyltransferase n=1 Tax=Mycoplasmopsis agassizii TaxID=33922 RepID=A0ABX4H5E8_9BACT|nr:nucleotidyltransferase family protein [Mycoplasmopsis agassizii]PAF55114.1 hypothetical protein CJF60_00295 [Mycoplasmopsis agassizii]SMC16577.1 Predicted nucleotidyltransferase [Mycoplasmopsis agassizii]
MKIAVIAEYNPFHYGHIRQLNWLKTNYPDSEIVIFLSDYFTQRGTINILDFEIRKKFSLQYGADQIIRLTDEEVVQGAPFFASKIISRFRENNITHISFGSELGSYEELKKLSDILKEQIDEGDYKNYFSLLKENKNISIKSNDILAISYIQAIEKLNLNISYLILKRNVDYNSEETIDNITSATNIRKMFLENKNIEKYTPAFKHVKNETELMQNWYFIFQSLFLNNLKYSYFYIKKINLELYNLFKKHIYAKSYNEFVKACTSKYTPASFVRRAMVNFYLEIKKGKGIDY